MTAVWTFVNIGYFISYDEYFLFGKLLSIYVVFDAGKGVWKDAFLAFLKALPQVTALVKLKFTVYMTCP